MKKASPPPRRPKVRKTRNKPAAAPAKRPSEGFPDRRAMEGFMAGLFGRVEANAHGAVDDAQEMMYDAWEASGAERVALARAALDISPLCADAYVLLAEEEPGSQQDALALYRQGVEAGERALGDVRGAVRPLLGISSDQTLYAGASRACDNIVASG